MGSFLLFPATCVRIRYCSDCDWFTQQTLHPTTRPINRCSRCGHQCRGMTKNCERLGGLMDYVVDADISIRRYSQKELKQLYLDAGGKIEKCVDGKLVREKF